MHQSFIKGLVDALLVLFSRVLAAFFLFYQALLLSELAKQHQSFIIELLSILLFFLSLLLACFFSSVSRHYLSFTSGLCFSLMFSFSSPQSCLLAVNKE